MKFHVTYRLIHPNYLPATRATLIKAESHTSLQHMLVSLKAKWEARGYHLRILRVVADASAERRRKKISFKHH